MHEWVILSGKGGTGKTSLAAAFATLARAPVMLTDCDVDAADLHLLIEPEWGTRIPFFAGYKAHVEETSCVRCGTCQQACRFQAIQSRADGVLAVNAFRCEGCGSCQTVCPHAAIALTQPQRGYWQKGIIRFGHFLHAQLDPGAENSGKLVALLRREARRLAEEKGCSIMITDGPPGIGCPVIASLADATQIVLIAEPSCSGYHDAERLILLAKQFACPVSICVNKWDINPAMTDALHRLAEKAQVHWLGCIRYSSAFVTAQRKHKTILEIDTAVADDVRQIWKNMCVHTAYR